MCRDFMGGRCRRGSQCHFLHQDIQSHENGCDDRQKRAGVSKYITRNDDKDYLVKSGRSTYCCTDYLKGNCRRGASCRFTHGDVSEGYSRGSINEINKERENKRNRVTAPERGVEREARKSSDIPCKYFAAGNCRNGNYCRFSHHGLDKLQDGAKPTDVDTSFNAERSWNASKGSDADVLNDATKPWTGPKWSDTGAYLGATKLNDDINEKVGASKPNGVVDSNDDMEMSPQWNYRIHSSVNKEKSHSSEATHVGTFLPSHEKNITEMASGQACDELSASQRMSTEKSNYQVDRLTMGSTSAALPCDGNAVSRNSSVSHIDPKFSTNILPTQNFDDPGPSLSSLPRSNLNVIGQSELSIPSNEVNTEVLQNSVLFQEEKPCTELHIGDKNILHGNCGSLATSNMVTSCAHSGGPAEPDSMPTVQPGQEISFPKQYDPRADSIDPAKKQDTNTKPLGFSVHSVSQEATKENGVLKIKKAEAENKNGLSENMEADDRNEEGKKRNDGKGLRAFKFALVEFVKDLLKPAWKEGQIGKEAYKSIVKKVVDKVIATMQGTNIPTTPEKIDQYLSFSKPKLSKLVQAYVEKFQKS
ncbi:Basic helix-loop-helix DNA-binding superfamily protein [Hibiscus syriacus]|uniref:Basic helix-loop-helix DNA-binding superfamily protein n=2 Tax=Hibiscus syriacus TaxID=106335 RepID=A0A6A2Z259_HIBSY|nr:Basic helix-loop-helix DNA-binding superfamily protein [Hibiscus syriacus]